MSDYAALVERLHSIIYHSRTVGYATSLIFVLRDVLSQHCKATKHALGFCYANKGQMQTIALFLWFNCSPQQAQSDRTD